MKDLTNEILGAESLPVIPATTTKVIHFARYISPDGDISPWCAKTPRKINLRKESWTNRKEASNCDLCIARSMEVGNERKS